MGAFNLRLDNETHEKLKYICEQQDRSQNKQVEFIIKRFIEDYEKVNGKIELEESEKTPSGLIVKKR